MSKPLTAEQARELLECEPLLTLDIQESIEAIASHAHVVLLSSDVQAALDAMDKVEGVGGDAPHRAVDLATRIMVQFAARASDVQEGRSVTMPVLTCPECGATDMNPHDNGCLSMKRFPVGTTKEQAAAWEAKHHPAPVAAVQSPPSRQALIDDLAMMMRRLICSSRNPDLAEKARDLLRRSGLQGSPLRTEPPPAAAPDTEQAQPQKDSSEEPWPIEMALAEAEVGRDYLHLDTCRDSTHALVALADAYMALRDAPAVGEQTVPEGFVLVPKEPTAAMMEAYMHAFVSTDRFDMKKVWAKMLAASAPEAAGQGSTGTGK